MNELFLKPIPRNTKVEPLQVHSSIITRVMTCLFVILILFSHCHLIGKRLKCYCQLFFLSNTLVLSLVFFSIADLRFILNKCFCVGPLKCFLSNNIREEQSAKTAFLESMLSPRFDLTFTNASAASFVDTRSNSSTFSPVLFL